jgi:hypothetical protein
MTPKSEADVITIFDNSDDLTRKRMIRQLIRGKFRTKNDFIDFIKMSLGISTWNRLEKRIVTKYYSYDDQIIDSLKKHETNKLFKDLVNKKGIVNESVRDKMTPKSEKDVKSMLPPIVDEVTELLKGKVKNFDIGLDRLYSNAYIEIYFELGKFAYQLEIFRLEESNHRYRLMGATGSNWQTVYVSNDSDRMINYIKGLLPSNESIRSKMTPISKKSLTKNLGSLTGVKLRDFVLKTILSHDAEMIGNIFQYCGRGLNDLGTQDKLIIMEEAIIYEEVGFLQYYLDRGMSLTVIEDLMRYAYRMNRERIGNMLRKRLPMNESVRDKMTPKSEEEIRLGLSKLSPDKRLKLGISRNLPWLVEEALKGGANPNMTYIGSSYPKGFTCLMKAIVTDCKRDIVYYLIKYGADVNAKTRNGSSVLGISKGMVSHNPDNMNMELVYHLVKSYVNGTNE